MAGSDDPARYLARLGTAEEQVTAVEGLLLEPTADPEVVEALNWFAYTVVPIDTASSRVSRRVFSLLVDRPAEYPWIQLPWGIPYSFAATRYERSIAATRFPPVWSNW